MGDRGYISVIPVRENKDYTYEVSYHSSGKKTSWTFSPDGADSKTAQAQYLGSTDSVAIFAVLKRKNLLTTKNSSFLMGLYLRNGKLAFDFETDKDKFNFLPMNVSTINGTSNFLVMGSYCDKDDNVTKGKALGLGMWLVNSQGKILNAKYNSWETEIGKHLNVNAKGRVEDIGYIFFHKILQTEDGNFCAVGEGYKRVVSAGGIALNSLARGKTHSKFTVGYIDFVKEKDYKGGTFNAISYENGKFTQDNSWETEISKVLNVNEKGRVQDFGDVFFHDLIETANGHFFAVYEGYRQSGRKMIVTDMLLLHFDEKFNVREAKVFDKNSNSVDLPANIQTINLASSGNYIKYGAYGFDYAFTQMDRSRQSFSVGYTDYVKDREYKGLTFNSISFNNGMINTDKINLKSEGSSMRIFAAKPGSVMILEYFKKEKKLDMRLEKLN